MKGIVKALIIVGVIGAVVATPVVFLYSTVQDTTTKEIVYDDNYSLKDTLKKKIVDAFDNTKETSKAKFSLTEYDINNAAKNAIDSFGSAISGVIPKAYCEISDGKYTFYIELQLGGLLKTRVALKTSIKEEKYENKNAYVFTIEQVDIGKLSNVGGLGLNLISSAISDETFEKVFTSKGFSIHSDIKGGKIVYVKEDFNANISNILKNENSLYSSLLNFSLDNNLLNLDFNDNNKLSLEFDFSQTRTNETYNNDLNKYNLDINKYLEKLTKLADENIVEESHYTDTLTYLINGYRYCSKEIKAYIEPLNLTSIGIIDNKLYTGENFTKVDRVQDMIKSRISLSGLLNNHVGTVTESELNASLKNSGSFGTGAAISYVTEEGKHKIAYFAIDDLFVDITEKYFYLDLGFSINGYKTQVFVIAEQQGFDTLQLNLKITDIYYGILPVTGDLKGELVKLMSTALQTSDRASLDPHTEILSIGFTELLENQLLKQTLDSMSNGSVAMTMSGSSIADAGTIDLTIVE